MKLTSQLIVASLGLAAPAVYARPLSPDPSAEMTSPRAGAPMPALLKRGMLADEPCASPSVALS